MPPIALEKQESDRLFNLVNKSVVVLIRSKDGDTVDYGTGSVIHVDRRKILISVDKSLIKDDESVAVRFYDNTQLIAGLYMLKTLSRHAVLKVDRVAGLNPLAVTFSELEVTRQNLFTLAAVDEKGELGLLTGTLGNPNCRAVDSSGNRAYGSENKFAMSCHVAGPRKIPDSNKDEIKEPEEMTRLIGAAVFDMNGLVIGTVDCADPLCYGLKFALKASFFLNILEKYLKEIDQKINLSRGKKAFNKGTIYHDTSSGSGSKKRGRMSTRDDTGTGKRVCMTQLDKVEVVSNEQFKVEMKGVKREAIHRALMRLVTRESDAAWSSSSSSLDAGIEANRCINVFIARKPDDVGSENSIAVEQFDLNHFFGQGGKIYGYKSLKISVWISAISFHVYADISFVETSNGSKGITDLKLALLNIFGENLVDKDEFIQTFSKECEYISDAVMNGRVIKHAASDDENLAVEIVRVELQGAAAVLYSRLLPLVLLLVKGSTIIDIKEHGWEMLLVVEKATHESSRPKFQLLGFAAARHSHYPESPLRTSQILVLPPYQHEYQHVLSDMVSCLKATKLSECSKMVPPAD